MSQLSELFNQVKEKNLTKTQLEDYHTELTSLFAAMQLEIGELTKAEALYFLEMKKMDEKETDVGIKRYWRGTPQGQRLITLTHSAKATEKILSSLRSRMYSQY